MKPLKTRIIPKSQLMERQRPVTPPDCPLDTPWHSAPPDALFLIGEWDPGQRLDFRRYDFWLSRTPPWQVMAVGLSAFVLQVPLAEVSLKLEGGHVFGAALRELLERYQTGDPDPTIQEAGALLTLRLLEKTHG